MAAIMALTYKWRSPDYSDADLLTNSLNEDISIVTTNGGQFPHGKPGIIPARRIVSSVITPMRIM